MKAVKINLAGADRYLAFTGEAMFRIQESFGKVKDLAEAMDLGTREGLSAMARAAAILAEQGELARRHMGYSETPIVSEEDIFSTIIPADILDIKAAIFTAINLGYGRDVEDENDEIDLGLVELEAQKKTT
ncbi:MAG: hypothetical protein J1E06_05755 [Acutalibacter sp.]|nr:hypothetical protein [Acutalibacter sp.]